MISEAHHRVDMGVGRIGRTRARPGRLRNSADAPLRLGTPVKVGSRRPTMGYKLVGLILAAIIAAGFVGGWMGMF